MSVYRRRVMQVKHPPNQITAVYNVTSTTSSTNLFKKMKYCPIIGIVIDGEEISGLPTSYKFSTLGNHEVRYLIKNDKSINGQELFNAMETLVSVDFSELRVDFSATKQMFINCTSLTSVKGLKLPIAKDVSGMFSGCTSLETLDASDWGMSNVTTTEGMFQACSSLKSLYAADWDLNLSASTRYMFGSCSKLETLDALNWGLRSITTAEQMFRSCTALKVLNVANWGLNALQDAHGMFYDCTTLESIDARNWDMSSLTKADSMFKNCQTLNNLDVSLWKISNLINAYDMFYNCYVLQSLDVSNWQVNKVTTAPNMFYNCRGLVSLDAPNWHMENLTTGAGMFSGCQKLSSVNLPNLGLEKLTSANSMFYYCKSLTSLNAANWNMGAVTDFSRMFESCEKMKSINAANWNTQNATTMSSMFENCKVLESLDARNWDLSNVLNWGNMFMSCSAIKDLKFHTNINSDAELSPANDFYSGVFYSAGSSATKLYYFPQFNFVHKFMPCVPSSWETIPTYTPTECISLEISAENRKGQSSTALLYVNAITNGHDLDGNALNNVELKGFVEVEIGRNMSSENVQKEVNFEYLGISKSITITQFVAVPTICATYNVTSTSEATPLLYLKINEKRITELELIRIDGTEIAIPSTNYVFPTTGSHVVEFFEKEDKPLNNIYQMFRERTNLKSVDLSHFDMSNITSTSSSGGTAYAFYNCTGLEKVVLPESIQYLGYYMFYNCSAVTSLTILKPTAPSLINAAFGASNYYIGQTNKAAGTNKFYVPAGATGYDQSYWLSTLCSTSYCGFTKVEIS